MHWSKTDKREEVIAKINTKERIEKLKKIKRSDEFKRKVSEGMKGKSSVWLKGKETWNKGKKLSLSPEIRNQMAINCRNTLHTPEMQRKAAIGRSQKNHWKWKGGITPENCKIRNSIEWRLWREAVFARDHWTCQECGEKSGILHPHHIKPFSKFPELRFAIDNGQTLCKLCHKNLHWPKNPKKE